MFKARFKEVLALQSYSKHYFARDVNNLSWIRDKTKVRNIYVPIGNFAVAEVVFRFNGLYGIWIFYEEIDKIPEEWFFNDWLCFLEDIRDIGYNGGYIGRDRFLLSAGKYLGLFDSFLIKC